MKTIHFKSGDTKRITQEELNALCGAMGNKGLKYQTFSDGTNVYLILNIEEILYID